MDYNQLIKERKARAAVDVAMLEHQPFTDELLKLLEQIYWTMKDDMPVALRSECFDVLDRCGVKV